ncbi:MAG: DUF3592 domain-containing protein [Chloroflexota bacterium]
MEKQRPSLFRIAFTDYPTFLSLISPLILWIGYFLSKSGTDSSLLYISIAVTVAAIPVIIWRILYFLKIFDVGEEATAEILGVRFYRSRGRVDFNYTYKGTDYTSSNLLLASERVRNLTAGKEVTVLVNPENPKKSVIRDMFI